MEKFVTTGVVAEDFGVTRSSVLRWVRQGKITPTWYTPAGQPRWTISDFYAQMEQFKNKNKESQ